MPLSRPKKEAPNAVAGPDNGVEPARGLIRTDLPATGLRHERLLPPEPLRALVRHYWWVEWELPSRTTQQNLPHPTIHLVFQDGDTRVFGVTTNRFSIELDCRGWVFGVKFQPGAFFSVLGKPVVSLTNRVVPARTIFGETVEPLNRKIHEASDMAERIELVSDYLLRLNPAIDAEMELASRLVHRLETDRELLRVEELCKSESLSPRRVQRLFRKYVGVSAKWVIRRYRLHEALERVETLLTAETEAIEWADFAQSLGYFDQAHFIKDFVAVIGCTPEQYEKRLTTRQSH